MSTPQNVPTGQTLFGATLEQLQSASSTQGTPRGLVRRHAKRMDCMSPLDDALYKEWSLDKSTRLSYPEWIVQRDNPGVKIPGLDWEHLWAGWEQ